MAILRSIWALLVFVVATTLIATMAISWSLVRGGREMSMRPAGLWGRVMLAALGARMRYEGLEHLLADRSCVYASNHQSNVDIWALAAVLPPHAKFVAKQSLFRIPFVGWAMRLAGFIPIDRERRNHALQSLRVAAERIQQGRSILLFPEGTRSKDGRLAPFKKGSFHLALQVGVPVVPIAINGSRAVLPPGKWIAHPGVVRVRFLPAIDVEPFQPGDHHGLRAAVRQAIVSALDESARPAPARHTHDAQDAARAKRGAD